MLMLHDRTRRFWLRFLFAVGCLVLTASFVWIIFVRNTNWASEKEGKRLSLATAASVFIGRTEFKKPNETYYENVAVSQKDGEETACFCPVLNVRWIPIEEISEMPISKFGETKSQKEKIRLKKELKDVVFRFDSLFDSSDYMDKKRLLSVNVSDISEKTYWTAEVEKQWNILDGYYVCHIPVLFLRLSTLSSIQEILYEHLEGQIIPGNRPLIFEIDRLLIVKSDESFSLVCHDARRFLEKCGKMAVSSEKIEEEEKADDSLKIWNVLDRNYQEDRNIQADQLVQVLVSFFALDDIRRFEITFFCPSQLKASPTENSKKRSRFALVHQDTKNKKQTDFLFDGTDTSFPTSFVAYFCPFFHFLGVESCISGILKGTFPESIRRDKLISKQKKNTVFCVFSDFHLYGGSVDTFVRRAMQTPFSGNISDIYLKKGVLQNGMFLAEGFFYLENGTIDKLFLQKLQTVFQLTVEPETALLNNFAKNSVPYDRLAIGFDMLPQGVYLRSTHSKRIIMDYKRDYFKYEVFFPEITGEEKLIPYLELISILGFDGKIPTIWTPFLKDAINHLPILPSELK